AAVEDVCDRHIATGPRAREGCRLGRVRARRPVDSAAHVRVPHRQQRPRATAARQKDGSMSDRINPHPGILLYTRIKKSPYYYGSRRHGVALYSVYNHHYHPRHYGDPIAEYWQLLEGVT